jgi:hypothetical protein
MFDWIKFTLEGVLEISVVVMPICFTAIVVYILPGVARVRYQRGILPRQWLRPPPQEAAQDLDALAIRLLKPRSKKDESFYVKITIQTLKFDIGPGERLELGRTYTLTTIGETSARSGERTLTNLDTLSCPVCWQDFDDESVVCAPACCDHIYCASCLATA